MQTQQIIFLGDAKAGKTQLISTFCKEGSILRNAETKSIDFKTYHFDNNKVICWDTPSTNNPLLLKDFFHRKNDICFVIDSTMELAGQFANVAAIINRFCKTLTFINPPRYVIVINKIDAINAQKDNLTGYKTYLENTTRVSVEFSAVSAVTEEGIDAFRQYICSSFKIAPAPMKKTKPFVVREKIEEKAITLPAPVINKSTPEYQNFLELKRRVNKELTEEYIGSIWSPSIATLKLPFAFFGIGPHHMGRAKAILNIINTRIHTAEEINAILNHEEALLSGKEPSEYSKKLIADPQLSTMKNVPEDPDSSGYYESIQACLDEVVELRTELRQSNRRVS